MTKKRTRAAREKRTTIGRPARGRKTLPFVYAVLAEATEPQTVAQILTGLIRQGWSMQAVTTSSTPINSISRDLSMDIKEKRDASKFVRVGRGRFALRSETSS